MTHSLEFYFKRLLALVAALLASLLITHWVGDQAYPIGWIYIALFGLAGLFTFIARGTFMWMLAVWLGAMLVVIVPEQGYPGDRWLSAILIGVQYLSAVLTGGLLGQWLRYRLALSRGRPLPLVPTAHELLVAGLLLLLLPALAFVMLAGMTIHNQNLATILMFLPGNTPFLFPALLAGGLCGYWVRSAAVQANDRRWGLILMIIAAALLIIAASLKFVFGFLELSGWLPA